MGNGTNFTRQLSNLRPIMYRDPAVVAALERAMPTFLSKMSHPLDESLIAHSTSVASRTYDITGDERACALAWIHDTEDHKIVAADFGAFLSDKRGLKTLGLEKDEIAVLMSLDGLVSPASFRRFQLLVESDRSDAHIRDKKAKYEALLGGVFGADIIRTICLANLAKIDRSTRRKIYEGLDLNDEQILRRYAPSIWYIYLAAAYRAGIAFEPFKDMQEDLGTVVTLGLDQHLYERLRGFLSKWRPALDNLRAEIEELLKRPFIKNIRGRLDDERPFEGNIKSLSMIVMKAILDLKMAGRVSEEEVKKEIKDMVRFRLYINEGEDPIQILDLVCNDLSNHGYEKVPITTDIMDDKGRVQAGKVVIGAHKRKNGQFYAVLKKDGFLIEFQARTPELHEELERGESKYHEKYIGRRPNSRFGLGEDENAVLNARTLLLIEARARILAEQHRMASENKRRQTSNQLAHVNLTIEYMPHGGGEGYLLPTFKGACIGDVVADSVGLLGQRVTVSMGGRVVDLTNALESDEIAITVHVGNQYFSANEARELLPYMNTLAGQSQCFAAMFADNYIRNGGSKKKK